MDSPSNLTATKDKPISPWTITQAEALTSQTLDPKTLNTIANDL